MYRCIEETNNQNNTSEYFMEFSIRNSNEYEFYDLNQYNIGTSPMTECTLRRSGRIVNLNFDSGQALIGKRTNSLLFKLPQELYHLFPSNAVFGNFTYNRNQTAELVLVMEGSINIWNHYILEEIQSPCYGSLIWII